jgi:hypothetical protein
MTSRIFEGLNISNTLKTREKLSRQIRKVIKDLKMKILIRKKEKVKIMETNRLYLTLKSLRGKKREVMQWSMVFCHMR